MAEAEAAVLDTHPLLFHAAGGRGLGPKAARLFARCERREAILYVPAVVMWECALLARTGRVNLRRGVGAFFGDLFSNPAYQPLDTTPADVFLADELRFTRDPFDALIVATARNAGLPLVTRDGVIRESGAISVIWCAASRQTEWHSMKTAVWPALAFLLAFASLASAQPVFRGSEIFPPEEFAARRAKVMAQVADGVAIVQGTMERPGEQAFRQNNQFFYLCGVVEPRAILVIDGRSRRTTLFLQPRNDRREQRMYGPGLSPGPEATQATAMDAVLDRQEFARVIADIADDGRTIFTPFRPEVLGEASSSDPAAMWRAIKSDPWDGRVSREEAFVAKLKAAAPRSEVRDLDPIIDGLRLIKSPREIQVLREAARLAGLGIMEAMRDARPGMYEYELIADADFVFKKGGAYGPSYFALIATGRNTYYSHYHKGTDMLRNGDLVQMDYGPDYRYYQGDVTRVFPASGKFTARQREFYSVYLALYRSLLASMKVHAAPRDIIKEAVVRMDAVMGSFKFTDAKIKAAAQAFVDRYRANKGNSLGHDVGMEVHDVRGPNPPATLEPGMVFTIEPAMQIEDEHIGMRLEDTLLVTETGIENLSAFVPIEIRDVEKFMSRKGLSDYRITR